MIHHFVALGDSFTEGVGDPVEGIPLRSAHDWLAEWMRAASPGLRYTNLASRGLRAGEIRAQQLQRGLSLEPDFVSVVAGANDCLKGPFSAERLRAELNLMLGAFQSVGARLFTATLPNFTLRLELPGGVRERVGRNLEAANHIIHDLAGRYDAIFFDFWESDLDKNPALWSEDGVHPNARGYLEIARQVAPVLERHGIAVRVPAAQGEGR
ncbi:lipolytic protein G-D-S-L family [Allomeiothermus silvanus DSM 9946]|uniref:Lipolytic protein G-D-S-L family n=1 Tax=Allomeiothermus silvanus (strain ATCC 700542 / DSM 9946 / NBRC 106475 / NCIMB 13440 / VI-R2) TaxID=526227 RepID=D7BFX6_ALLS1|nr:SGNH/GDSL hydrolase family protein [Allomeiothermus silvanus]ADH63679.1 lipolytic protein G-D-S-L family [Allomeiothermus silvanus DSM 9946]